MRELVNFVKELCMLKAEDNTMVGLSSFKRTTKPIKAKPKKQNVQKEMKLSDLMRKSSSIY